MGHIALSHGADTSCPREATSSASRSVRIHSVKQAFSLRRRTPRVPAGVIVAFTATKHDLSRHAANLQLSSLSGIACCDVVKREI